MFTSIGAPEIFVIFLIILVLFGADKLPEIAQSIGKGMNEFKKASDNLKDEIENGKREIDDTYGSTFKDPWEYFDEDYYDEDDNNVEPQGKEHAKAEEHVKRNNESPKETDNQQNSN